MKWIDIQKEYFRMEFDENFECPKQVNKNYRGGEVIVVKSCPTRILDFLRALAKKNASYIYYVKEVILRCAKAEEWVADASYLVIDKEFAEKIQLKGHFRWINKGWGEFSASLTYDLSNL